MENIKLTRFSHGAGCGCKISPAILNNILTSIIHQKTFPALMIGNATRDDAAVYDLGNGTAVISTTDFFMPIVDDPYDFGRIASVNAISDVYAMGGKPLMAIALLGWPIDKIPPEIASHVLQGAIAVCEEAGIPLAGGHSIDSPEPIFGLAVTGIVKTSYVKSNAHARPNDLLYLTKPIGIGIITTAQKKNIVRDKDLQEAIQWMTTLNKIGEIAGTLPYVHAMTDVTGFGLLGHLISMCEASQVSATLHMENIPVIPSAFHYLSQNTIPGGTHRNWKSYGEKVSTLTEEQRLLLADPQTSGGLLIAIDPQEKSSFERILQMQQIKPHCIGTITEKSSPTVIIK